MRKKLEAKPVFTRACAAADCIFAGEYKAPKSRYHTEEYQYLCLEHIREFNQAWDYFAGWSRKEIEDFMDGSHHGHRPTWNMTARLADTIPFFTSDSLHQRFLEMLGEKQPEKGNKPAIALPRKQREALAILDLPLDVDLPNIKSRYKKLVKQHHPDVNKGDKTSEELFKNITAAYTTLIAIYGKQDEK